MNNIIFNSEIIKCTNCNSNILKMNKLLFFVKYEKITFFCKTCKTYIDGTEHHKYLCNNYNICEYIDRHYFCTKDCYISYKWKEHSKISLF